MPIENGKAVATYKSPSAAVTNLFGDLLETFEVQKQLYAGLGMRIMCKKVIDACDILLAQPRISKADIRELKRLNEACYQDILWQMEEIAGEEEKTPDNVDTKKEKGKAKMTKLPPSYFEFGKYDAGTIPTNIAIGSMDKYVDFLMKSNIVGYCDSEECIYRPRTDDMAVMIDEDGYETWAHVPKDVWNEFMKRLNGD